MAGKLLKHIIHCLHTKLFFQPGRRIQCLDLAVHHNRYPVAIFRFIHIVCGNKYSDSTIGSLINQLPELPASSRINSSGRFIKEDYFGSWKIETEKASFCFQPKGSFFTNVSRSSANPRRSNNSSVFSSISISFIP